VSTFVHWYYHRHQTRLEFPWFSEPWISDYVNEQEVYPYVFAAISPFSPF